MKVILITGGSGEIGSAISKKFAEQGYAVIITYNSNQSRAEKLLSGLKGDHHSIFNASITDSTAVQN